MSGIHIQNAKLKKRIKELEEENEKLKKQIVSLMHHQHGPFVIDNQIDTREHVAGLGCDTSEGGTR